MRLIDADALMEDIERTIEQSGCVNHESEIMDCVLYAPTIEPKRGKWKLNKSPLKQAYSICSVCNTDFKFKDVKGTFIWLDMGDLNYCPNCGSYNGGESCENQ